MEENFLEFMWIWLHRVDISISIPTAIFAGLAWLKSRQNQKRLDYIYGSTPAVKDIKNHIEAYKGIQTGNPRAFVLSLLPDSHSQSISVTVNSFLKAQKLEMKIEELNMNGIQTEEDIEKLINGLREKRRIFEAQNVTELHLFIAGPVTAGVIIGALYDNWITIKLYNRSKSPGAFY